MPVQKYPVLVCITNTHKAVWLSLPEGRGPVEIESFSTPKAIFSDKESYFKSGIRGNVFRTGTSIDLNRQWLHETRTHLQTVGEKTKLHWQPGNFKRLVVAAPEEIKQTLEREFTKTLKKVPYRFIAGNYIHKSVFPTLIARIKKPLVSSLSRI